MILSKSFSEKLKYIFTGNDIDEDFFEELEFCLISADIGSDTTEYILDEIEAALDDANVERFAKYLKNFSSDTQFIVITHRKPTMELADCLYGVTMEEKGVSKMVSVKLSDAVKNSTEGA